MMWKTSIRITSDEVVVNDYSLTVTEMLCLVVLWMMLVFVVMVIFIWLFIDTAGDLTTTVLLVFVASGILVAALNLDFILGIFDARSGAKNHYLVSRYVGSIATKLYFTIYYNTCGGRRSFGFAERFAAPQRPSAVGVLVLVPRRGSASLRRAITQALRA